MKNTKDLTKEAPRSPRVRLGGYVLMGRMIDKGRAALAGKAGEYHFACPLDQILFGFKAVKAEEVRGVLEAGASDEDVVAWFDSHGAPKTAEEIAEWSAGVEVWSPYHDPEKKEWFVGECTRLGLDPAVTSGVAYLDADDAASFTA